MNRPEPREMLVTQTFDMATLEGEDYVEPMYRCDEADPFMDWQEKRIVELEEALQEYGRHKSGCGYFDPEVLDCTCGLSALKEGT
jgi:hypothetical protein